MILRKSILAISSLCLAAAAFATDVAAPSPTLEKIRARGRLVAGSSFHYRIFNSKNPATGQYEGFMVDLTKLLAKKLLGDESKVEWRFVEEGGDYHQVNRGEVDVIVDTSERGRRSEKIGLAEFSGEIYRSGPAFMVKKGSPIYCIDDIMPKTRLGFVSSGPAARYIPGIKARAPNATYVEYKDTAEAVAALEAGRLDAYTDVLPRLYEVAMQKPALTLVGRYSEKPFFFISPKGDASWREYLKAFIADLKASGEYEKLYTKWFVPYGGRMVQ